MVEGDRLFSPEADAQADEEEKKKEPYCQSNKEEFHTENRRVRIGLFAGSPGSKILDHQHRSLNLKGKGFTNQYNKLRIFNGKKPYFENASKSF